jgi:hypothetical protein
MVKISVKFNNGTKTVLKREKREKGVREKGRKGEREKGRKVRERWTDRRITISS